MHGEYETTIEAYSENIDEIYERLMNYLTQ